MTTAIPGRSEDGGWLIRSLIILGTLGAALGAGRLLGLPGVAGTALAIFASYVAWRWVAMFVGRREAREDDQDTSLRADVLGADESPSRSLPHVSIPFQISRLGAASMLFDALTEFDQDLVDQLTEPQPGWKKKITRWTTRRRVKCVLRLDRGLYEFKDAEIGRVSIRVPGCGLGCCPTQVDMEVSVPGSGRYQASLDLLVPCLNEPRETEREQIELRPGDTWIDDTGRRFRLPIPVVLAVLRNSDDAPALAGLGTRSRPFRGAGADGP